MRDRKEEIAWQDQRVFKASERLSEMMVILFPARNEVRQLCELRSTQGGLHVGRFQVIADMRIGVLVVVSAGERSQLPLEALATSVIFPGFAPAVATPIAERFNQRLQIGFIGEDGSALTRGDVVGGIETHGGNIAKGADVTSPIS